MRTFTLFVCILLLLAADGCVYKPPGDKACSGQSQCLAGYICQQNRCLKATNPSENTSEASEATQEPSGADEPTNEPINEPTNEPAREVTKEPTPEPPPEPRAELTPDTLDATEPPGPDEPTPGDLGTPDARPDAKPTDTASEPVDAGPDTAPDLTPQEGRPDLRSQAKSLWLRGASFARLARADALTVDSNRNVYVTGHFAGTIAFGIHQISGSSQQKNLFVAKLDAAGNWKWAVSAGFSGFSEGAGIASDGVGNVYVIGRASGTGAISVLTPKRTKSVDIFIGKLDTTGKWQWATLTGGSGIDIGYGIAADHAGNVYATGSFLGSTFFGPKTLKGSSQNHAFVGKMNTQGKWQWVLDAKNANTIGKGVALDNQKRVWIIGETSAVASFGTHKTTHNQSQDIFVARASASGLSWQMAASAGSPSTDVAAGIAVDKNNNAYITGSFTKKMDFVHASTPRSLNAPTTREFFVAKIDDKGQWRWAKSTKSTKASGGFGIAVKGASEVAVTGKFGGTTTLGALPSLTAKGAADILVARLNASTGAWLGGVRAGGSTPSPATDWGMGVAFDPQGPLVVAGFYSGTSDFLNSKTTGSAGNNLFVWKFSP